MGPSLADKVAYLSSDAWPDRRVEVIETHMSYVFLIGDRAYKLKKPVVQPYLDYRSPEARRVDCLAEVALNQALAPGVYLGVEELTADAGGRLGLGGGGTAIDWLVVMRRLHRADLLDRRIANGVASAAELDPVVEVLVAFYRSAPPWPTTPGRHRESLSSICELDLTELTSADLGFAPHFVEAFGAALLECVGEQDALGERARSLVDGHGDLRPEHVRPGPEPLVIDRLSFDDQLRRVDPCFDLSLLAVECEHLGAPELGDHVMSVYRARSGDGVDDGVIALYGALRATTRARLSVAHLHDGVDNRRKWLDRGRSYLTIARRHLDRVG